MKRNLVLVFFLLLVLGLVEYLKNRNPSKEENLVQSSQVASGNNLATKKPKPIVAKGAAQPVVKNKAPSRLQYHSINELQADFGSGWSAFESDSKVSSVLVSDISGPALNEQNIKEFVEKLKPLFGAANAEVIFASANPELQTFDFSQKIKEYDVYGGRLRVITHPEAGTPVIINNELKPIEKLNEQVIYSAGSAKDLIQKNIIDPELPIKLTVDEKLLAYSESDQSGVLVWLVHAQWLKNNKLHSSDFLVSAASGAILFERDLVQY